MSESTEVGQSAEPQSDPITDTERNKTLLEAIENKVNFELGPLRAFADTAGPALESLKKSHSDLSDDYKKLSDSWLRHEESLHRMTEQSTLIASSVHNLAEHIGVLIGNASRIEGRVKAVEDRTASSESVHRTAAEATDKELASLRKATSDNRNKIIELTQNAPDIQTPEEITSIRRMPPVATAVENELARLTVERVRLTVEKDKAMLDDERENRQQMRHFRGKILKYGGAAIGFLITVGAIFLAGRYLGYKAGSETGPSAPTPPALNGTNGAKK
jgi:chromosome segregation ATPase